MNSLTLASSTGFSNFPSTLKVVAHTAPSAADNCFTILLTELEKYDKDVEIHYEEYKRTNAIWNELKGKFNNEVN